MAMNVTADPQNSTLVNVTSAPSSVTSSMAHKVISSIAISALIILTVSGNALVIASFYQYKRIRRSVTNCFIVSLAFSDLMVAFLAEPFWLSFQITQWKSLPSGWNLMSLTLFWTVLDIICAISSIVNLMFISIDRYFAIKSPLSHHTKMTTNASKWIILGLWLYSLGTGGIIVVNWDWKFLLIFIIGFLVPLIVMIFCYSGIIVVISSKARLSNRLGRRLDKEFKTAKSLGVVTGSFVLCWLPFFIVSLAHKYCRSCEKAIDKVPAVASAVIWLHYLNSCLNPIIYAFLNPTFKVAFRNLFRKLCNDLQAIERDHSFSISIRQSAKRPATKTTSVRRSSNKGAPKENGKVGNGTLPEKKPRNKNRKLRFKTPLEESYQDSSSTDKNEKFQIVYPGYEDPSEEAPCLPPGPTNHMKTDALQFCTDEAQQSSLVPLIKDNSSTESSLYQAPGSDSHEGSSFQSLAKDSESAVSDSNNNSGRRSNNNSDSGTYNDPATLSYNSPGRRTYNELSRPYNNFSNLPNSELYKNSSNGLCNNSNSASHNDFDGRIPRSPGSELCNNLQDGSSEKLIPKPAYKDYTSLDSLPSDTLLPTFAMGGSLDLMNEAHLSDRTDSTDIKSLGSVAFDTQFSMFVDQESNQCFLMVNGELISDTDIKTSDV